MRVEVPPLSQFEWGKTRTEFGGRSLKVDQFWTWIYFGSVHQLWFRVLFLTAVLKPSLWLMGTVVLVLWVTSCFTFEITAVVVGCRQTDPLTLLIRGPVPKVKPLLFDSAGLGSGSFWSFSWLGNTGLTCVGVPGFVCGKHCLVMLVLGCGRIVFCLRMFQTPWNNPELSKCQGKVLQCFLYL